MSDIDEDVLLHTAFNEFRTATLPRIVPAGVQAAEATNAHRRKVRVVVAAVAAAVIVAVPTLAYGLTRTDATPLPPAPATSDTAPPAPSVPEPSTGPPSSAPADLPPIGASELRNATIDVPAWLDGEDFEGRCLDGRRTFTNGRTNPADTAPVVAMMGDPAYADIDNDGGKETAVLIGCYFQGGYFQVIVVDRTVAGGIRTVGRVVISTGEIAAIYDIAGSDDGEVLAKVSEEQICCGVEEEYVQQQWRGYRWNGTRFTQSSGPTKFGPNPKLADRAVTSISDVVFGPPGSATENAPDGRLGRLRFTVVNKGPARVTQLRITVLAPPYVSRPGTAMAACTTFDTSMNFHGYVEMTCTYGPMEPGESRQFEYLLLAPGNADTLPVGEPWVAAGGDPPDGNPDNSGAVPYRITFQN